MNIIFLDIDGVLNNREYLSSIYNKKLKLIKESKYIEAKLLEINPDSLKVLIQIVKETNSFVVITGALRHDDEYPIIKNILNDMGLNIIDELAGSDDKRDEEIIKYINTHDINSFLVLDDDTFNKYYLIQDNFVKTQFWGKGLTIEEKPKCLSILKKSH